MAAAVKIASTLAARTTARAATSTIWTATGGRVSSGRRAARAFLLPITAKWNAPRTWITRTWATSNRTTRRCSPKLAEVTLAAARGRRAAASNRERSTTRARLASFAATKATN